MYKNNAEYSNRAEHKGMAEMLRPLLTRRWDMLRIAPLSRQDQRTLRQWQHQAHPRLAQRARLILWAAQGWSVPALARVFHCGRRTVRRWFPVFLGQGLAGLQGHPIGRPPHTHS